MPRHPLNALLRLIAITYREKFCTYKNQKIYFDQLLISYLQTQRTNKIILDNGGG
jgi:hypothetical protein